MAKSSSSDDAPESAPTQPDPWAILDRLASALAQAQQSPKAQENEGVMLRLAEALERVSQAQVDGAKIIAAEHRRAVRPSNEVIPGRSVFNRRGTLLPDNAQGPRKMPLKCPMLIPWLVEWESCTREEVDLLNLLESGDYTLTLSDRSKIRVEVRINYKADGVTPSRLLLNHVDSEGKPGTAFGQESFRNIPALVDMLRNILKQHSPEVRARAAAVMTDEEEEALIEAGALAVSA